MTTRTTVKGIRVPQPDRIVDAMPTKELFITMLVKDIPLIRAIIDLVDNSVDGAIRLKRDGDYTGLWVRIEATPNLFRIADNCGGITVDQARNYAFRFGRPQGARTTTHSIGQFGVGMKRALFKLGNDFTVESTTSNSRFLVHVEVDSWKDEDEWNFSFNELEVNRFPQNQRGTIITVIQLHPSITAAFELENFQTRLASELTAAHQVSIGKGLSISLNGLPLEYQPAELLQSNSLKPAYKEVTLVDRTPIKVKIYAGIAESVPSEAGWYVFCNGRLVLEADQTNVTGWGEGNGKVIPKYHNQFARFRGYVFFDCDDAGLLPWNTTKTGVDTDSPHYRAIRQQMITLMRPVIDFLNKLDAENASDLDDRPFQTAVEQAGTVRLAAVTTAPTFVVPVSRPRRSVRTTSVIRYEKPNEKINLVKECLNVNTLREVGELTFDYYYQRECED